MKKKLDGNYTRMLRTILNKSWKQHPTKQQPYSHLPPITKTIKVRRTGHAGHCWRSKGELISDILRWTLSHGRAKAGRPARTYIHQLCADTGCSPEDLPEAMEDREGWRERVRDIRADGVTWWWYNYWYCHTLEIFFAASHQIGLDTRSKARRPVKVGINGRRRLGTSRDSNPAGHWPSKCNVGPMSQTESRT